MARNFTLAGIGALVQFGKGNAQLKSTSSTQFEVRDDGDAAFANMAGADAVSQDDFVTKRDLDNAVIGLAWKDPARLASTANVVIASELEAGDSIDGVVLVAGDRVLLKNQTDPIENGVYIASVSGAAARSTDMATGADATNFALFISEGSVNADTAYVQTAEPAIIGTDGLTWTQFAGGSGVTTVNSVGAGVSLVANSGPPTAEIRSLDNPIGDGTIVIALSGNEVELSVGTILEANLSTGVAVLYRFLTVVAADFPASAGSTPVNVGAVLPANAVVQGGQIFVATAFDNSPDLEVGIGGDVDAVYETGDVDLTAIDSYVSSRASRQSSAQLIATLTTVGTQPTVGSADIMVNFVRPS